MKKLTVFFGPIGSGKTYSAQQLMKKNKKIQQIDFKDPLIDMSYRLSKTDQSYDDFKKCVIGCNSVEDSKKLLEICPTLPTGRDILQRLGTDCLRSYTPNIFVQLFKETLADSSAKEFVNCDMRFVNELCAILGLQDFDVNFIYCNYKSELYDDKNKHASEKMVQAFKSYYKGNIGDAVNIPFTSGQMADFILAYNAGEFA